MLISQMINAEVITITILSFPLLFTSCMGIPLDHHTHTRQGLCERRPNSGGAFLLLLTFIPPDFPTPSHFFLPVLYLIGH